MVPFDSETEQRCRENNIVLMPYDTKLEAECVPALLPQCMTCVALSADSISASVVGNSLQEHAK